MHAAKMSLERSDASIILILNVNEGDILLREFPAFNWGNRAFKILTSTENDMQ